MGIRTTRHVSERGVAFIGKWEGFRGIPYNDVAGHCTIGYGHLIHHGNCSKADRKKWGEINKAEGRELLRRDLKKYEKGVRDLLGFRVRRTLNQQNFDALVSFAYNVGLGAFAGSSMLRLLRARHRGYAAREFDKWVHAGGKRVEGLINRRNAEQRLFTHRKYY